MPSGFVLEVSHIQDRDEGHSSEPPAELAVLHASAVPVVEAVDDAEEAEGQAHHL